MTDRELDALVAEKVMGLFVDRSHETNGQFHAKGAGVEYIGFEMGGWDEVVPKYSTDIAAAWQVAEKLNEILQSEFCLSCVNGEWTVYRCWHTDSEPLGWAPTAPLAICIAALRAVGVSEKKLDQICDRILRSLR